MPPQPNRARTRPAPPDAEARPPGVAARRDHANRGGPLPRGGGPGDEDLGRADDDLVVADAGVVALPDDQREQDDAHRRPGGLPLLVAGGGGGVAVGAAAVGAAAGPLVHELRVEGDRLDQVARVVVLGLQRREHHVLCALGAHLDRQVDGLAHDAPELVLDLVLHVARRRQDDRQRLEDGLHHRLGVLVALLPERRPARQERERDGAPLPHRLRRPHLEEHLLERLELLALLAVHAEEVPREDELPDHGRRHAHEDVAPPHPVAEVLVDVGAVQHRVVEPVDDLLVVDLRREAARAHVAELAEPEHPLLHVGAQLLAPVVEVIDVLDVEELAVAGRIGGQDLVLHLPDLLLGGFELGAQVCDLGILVFQRPAVVVVGAAQLFEVSRCVGVLRLELAVALGVRHGYLGIRAAEAFIDFGQAIDFLLQVGKRLFEGVDFGIAFCDEADCAMAR